MPEDREAYRPSILLLPGLELRPGAALDALLPMPRTEARETGRAVASERRPRPTADPQSGFVDAPAARPSFEDVPAAEVPSLAPWAYIEPELARVDTRVLAHPIPAWADMRYDDDGVDIEHADRSRAIAIAVAMLVAAVLLVAAASAARGSDGPSPITAPRHAEQSVR